MPLVMIADRFAAHKHRLHGREPGGHIRVVWLDLEPADGMQSDGVRGVQTYVQQHFVAIH